jgi:hypothetical protein
MYEQKQQDCHTATKPSSFSVYGMDHRERRQKGEGGGGAGQVLNIGLLAERRAGNGFGWVLKREAAVSIRVQRI